METIRKTLNTHEKALHINLNARFYGTFAEIGAGQEVARWFFRVGGAAGTIAKSISAYDMLFSDAIYGSGERYVSENRLNKMLTHEYNLLIERLQEKRAATSCFFAFAETVAARSFKGTSECHGWMGIKFQVQPMAEPNYIVMHVRMLDKENVQQQEALGIIGVNLCYGAFMYHSEPEALIKSLLDNLSTDRIEVDMIRFTGPYFQQVDNRLMALRLVEEGLSDAALLGPKGDVLQASEVLYRKAILVERGSFRPVTHVNLDMMAGARDRFMADNQVKEDEVVEIMEITMRNLLTTGIIDHRDFLARADLIGTVGKYVLISNYAEYYRLAAFLWRYSKKGIGIVMGIPNLQEIFNEKYYENLEGGIFESFGRLFKNQLKIYVYPTLDAGTMDRIITANDLEVPAHLRNLYEHLIENKNVECIDKYNPANLKIFSRAVLAKIRDRDPSWVQMVPPEVASLIKERFYFGFRHN
ncbi:MAG: TonB-dependent receptor [Candidatus Methylacidiphilales bacterium]|nr:TonB-dependent receptor [Candidatus Methylacidiphilales bacterium]